MENALEIRILYVTTRDRSQALRIGRTLIERRLAACVNVLDGMTSVYEWQGRIEEATEAVLLVKTDAARTPPAIAAIRECHDYEVPCVLALPVVDGNPDYL